MVRISSKKQYMYCYLWFYENSRYDKI